MGNSRPTQCDKIVRHLRDHKSISQIEALQEYGIMRLASRITELKKRGYTINKEWVKTKNRYGEPVSFLRYSIEEVDNAVRN